MRITAEAKSATRQRILQAATGLFAAEGWHQTTTRGIAQSAGIATGTLFNYFPNKEAIAADLVAEALARAGESFRAAECNGKNLLEADLFTLIWSGLRSLREYREFLGPACETIFSPLARPSPESPGDAIRVDHLELMQSIVTAHGYPALPAVTVQLYWTLFLGVFAYWAADESPGQEDTLALLDQSLKLFAASLGRGAEQGRGN